MYIEEVLNKGYQNNDIEAFRIFLEDPSLTFDLSKVSLDGGMLTVDDNDLLNASILQWNRLGVPVGLNASNGPSLYTIPNRAKESLVSLTQLTNFAPFLIHIPNKQYTGPTDLVNNTFDFEIGRNYRLEFYVKYNNCTSATFSFFENTADEWFTLYGLTFSNPTETLVDTDFRWHRITTDITKTEEGTQDTSRIMLNISDFTILYPERATLALLSDLRIVEII